MIKDVLDQLNSEYCQDGEKLNSCVVNKFSGPDSCLAEHSDNEFSIAPESSIYTIALGDTCSIKFRELHTGVNSVHTCLDRSMYVMTRRSQDHFEHSIETGEIQKFRYSLTFRCVSWRNYNSTILLGDSNTQKLLFCEEKGTFGKATPGKSVWAPTIDKIDPNITLGYTNVVFLCGINDLKHSYVKSQSDVHNIYLELQRKIELIHHINGRAKIFICPLLPTRLHNINQKVFYFNSLIRDCLLVKYYNISTVLGFVDFVDEQDRLADKYCRSTGDYLHLNTHGVRVLATKIKEQIFLRKKKRSGAVTPSLKYSDAARVDPSSHLS